jgi:hypothetical protein
MHARLKTMASRQALMYKAKFRDEARRQENLKKLEDERPKGGKTARKSEVREEHRQEKFKTRKGLKTNIRRWGRGCQVRWAPCVKVGLKNRGAAKAC